MLRGLLVIRYQKVMAGIDGMVSEITPIVAATSRVDGWGS
jgi:hypothetical protein